MTSFYSVEELSALGVQQYGDDVRISRKASLYNPEKLRIGDHVRIDDFCILSGEITLGSYIHISAYAAIYGSMGVAMDDFSGLSPRATLFSAMDDFSGDYLINPMVDNRFTNVKGGKIRLGKYVQIGAGSIVFPCVEIAEGSVVGALSLVNKSLPSWGVYGGVPAHFLKERRKGLLTFVEQMK